MAFRQPERSELDPAADAHPAGTSGAVWLTVCAWCARMRVRDEWINALHTLEVMAAGDAQLTHGICPSCFDATAAKAERERRLDAR